MNNYRKIVIADNSEVEQNIRVTFGAGYRIVM